MKKQNKFLKNKTFVIFGILAILIVLCAVFAPVVTGG
ncbi:MAG: nickel ABC transporter permease subunit NikC, partial [Eubacterium sp.]|nr:nickel ABC transporter permease subunit NikC [Eubacterium sp.]